MVDAQDCGAHQNTPLRRCTYEFKKSAQFLYREKSKWELAQEGKTGVGRHYRWHLRKAYHVLDARAHDPSTYLLKWRDHRVQVTKSCFV